MTRKTTPKTAATASRRGGGAKKSDASQREDPASSPCVCAPQEVCAPDELDPRGRALWSALREQVAGNPAAQVLLAEACRIADRLDGLDRILRGENHELLKVAVDDAGECRLYVDAALSEARQQANTLRQLVAALPAKESDGDDADAWLSALPTPIRDAANQ